MTFSNKTHYLLLLLLIWPLCLNAAPTASDADAKKILTEAMNQWRGLTSVSEMTMTIKREDWRRAMSMKAWTKGDKQSLVRVTAPKKDAGNGTLLVDDEMWSYTPKINRVIKIPSSMMAQSWMGSDFTNKDISKSTDVLDQYTHRLLETLEASGHTQYWIEAIPLENAAVVWGKELYLIRDDYVMLEQQFWDQDGELVKTLKTLEIKTMGGRVVASKMRMGEVTSPKEWTEMETHSIAFDVSLSDNLFTLSNLRNPR